MAEFEVTLPFAGALYMTVTADDEESAIEAAIDLAGEKVRVKCESGVELAEWEPLKLIVKGNVCYAPFWEAEAREVEGS